MVLAQRKLHVEQWDPPKNGHDGVRDEERACGRQKAISVPTHAHPKTALDTATCGVIKLPAVSATLPASPVAHLASWSWCFASSYGIVTSREAQDNFSLISDMLP